MLLEQISNIEKRLGGSADTLRANSNFASNEYFVPVMGLIFLRHAYSRCLKALLQNSTAEIHIRIIRRLSRAHGGRLLTHDRFSALGTAEMVRVA